MKNKLKILMSLIILFSNIYFLSAQEVQWKPVELDFKASDTIPWYEFPLQVTFTHADTDTQIVLDAYWNGDSIWAVRFVPTLCGTWYWQSFSEDEGLNAKSGSIDCTVPSSSEIEINPNLRGHLKISSDLRRFEYADGTPFFWLGGTNWAIYSDRCGIENGNFYTYVDNRKEKKFNVIQIQFFSRKYYNEGGYAFPNNIDPDASNNDWTQLNPDYFKYHDMRIQYLFDNGFVVAGHPTWFSSIFVTLPWAEKIMRYLSARYSAYNVIWSLCGEYQFSRDNNYSLDCPSDWDSLGNFFQLYNPYNHAVTIHPTYGSPDYYDGKGDFSDYSSSGEFHDSAWLNINWIQTGVFIEDISEATYSDYIKTPVKPVILSEPGYEFYPSSSSEMYQQVYGSIDVYLCRLQAWSSILCGAAGYTYGAWGVWQFYDPTHPDQPGSDRKESEPWYTRIDAPGAMQMQFLRTFFTSSYLDWTKLEPYRDWIKVNNVNPSWPTKTDFSPPHCAASPGEAYVVYIPKGNTGKTITITNLDDNNYYAAWYNPRTGSYFTVDGPQGVSEWEIPDLPDSDDWIFFLSINSITGLDTHKIPEGLQLSVYPNPLNNDSFTISYQLSAPSAVNIQVIDARGTIIKKLSFKNQNQGYHKTNMLTTDFTKGIYFVKLMTEKNMDIVRLLIF